MRRRPPRPAESGIYEVNMTPLIDVSLVLVVILMVATPLAFQSSIRVHSASASGRDAAVRAKEDRVELTVRADGNVLVNREVVARAALAATLGPLIQHSASRLVVVRCEDAVTHGAFVGVIDEARTLGADHIAVVGS
jgi:biopolymer transport protein TolR